MPGVNGYVNSPANYIQVDPATDLPFDVEVEFGKPTTAIEVQSTGGCSITVEQPDATSRTLDLKADTWYRVMQVERITACDGDNIIVWVS